MKKTVTRLALLALIFGMGLGTAAQAQHRHSHHSSYSSHRHVDHAIHDIETTAHLAMLGSAIASTTDYHGLRFGYNSASYRLQDLDHVDPSVNSGFNIGYVWAWYLGNSPVIIEPGIYYSRKGGKLSGQDIYDGETCHTRLSSYYHSIEIPLVFKYEIQCRNLGICLQPFFGGFIAANGGGETKENNSIYNRDVFDTIGDGDGQLDYSDAGLRFGCGVGIGHFYLEAAYDLGCTNLGNEHYNYFGYDHFDDAIRSGCLSLNVGFNF